MDNYIVSARKYRPSTFRSVVGQKSLTTTLKNAIQSNKLAHAYLFCGPRGVGKTSCARIFAKTINCLNPTADGEACNECESCKAFNEQRSYNIHELDAASNNSVDDIRALIDQVRIPPPIGKYKVFIIDEVHMLSSAAFNAFLKTLEEPPAYAVFLLLAENQTAFLPTILSRTVTLHIRPLPDTMVADYLEKKKGLSPADSAVYAAYAQGSIGQALDLLEDESFQQMRQEILEKLMALPQAKKGEVFLWAKDLEKYKNDLRFLDMMQLWYRDLLYAKRLRSEKDLIQKDKKAEIFRSAVESEGELARKAALIQRARVQLARNANFRLTMEVMLLQLKEN